MLDHPGGAVLADPPRIGCVAQLHPAPCGYGQQRLLEDHPKGLDPWIRMIPLVSLQGGKIYMNG